MKRILPLALAVALGACTTSAAPSRVDAGVDAPPSCRDVAGAIPGTPVATFDQDVAGFVLDQAPGAGAQ